MRENFHVHTRCEGDGILQFSEIVDREATMDREITPNHDVGDSAEDQKGKSLLQSIGLSLMSLRWVPLTIQNLRQIATTKNCCSGNSYCRMSKTAQIPSTVNPASR